MLPVLDSQPRQEQYLDTQGPTGRCGVNSVVYRNDQLKGSHELLPAYILLASRLVPSQAKRSGIDLVISITIANNY